MKVITLGEIMLRLCPVERERFVQADRFTAVYGGGEANVAVSLATLGEESVFVTKVPNNELGQAAVNSLRRYGVDTRRIVRGEGRLGIYFLERGASQRPDKVLYDRANSAFSLSDEHEYDWDAIFDGADWLHFTGITPALGERARALTERALKEAKKRGVTVSCDVNYRKKLWTLEEARPVLEHFMQYVDVCITNGSQAEEVFGITPAQEGQEGDIEIARTLLERFHLQTVALTFRRSINADLNRIAGMLYQNGTAAFSRWYEIDIVDRIGGGDAFGAALIYALLHGFSPQESIDFAVAANCLKHTVEGDYNLSTAEEICALAHGDGTGRVDR